jgi:hypothetical protein
VRAPAVDDELSGLMRDFAREEALTREAMALGLDRDDTIVPPTRAENGVPVAQRGCGRTANQ